MASINQRHGRLFFDFRYQGQRCREYTALEDSPSNRKRMEAVLKKVVTEISLGTFDYKRFFPSSSMAARFTAAEASEVQGLASSEVIESARFDTFSTEWHREKAVEWRRSYQDAVTNILKVHLLPAFAELDLSEISRARVMAFRAGLAELTVNHASGPRRLAPATINRIMGVLRMILDEGAQRYGLVNPCQSLKRLRLQKTDIEPFTVDQVRQLIQTVRPDFSDYLLIRFFTGMRSGEVHGLKWDHVDFERREIRIRETFVKGRTEYTKTDGSQREIQMSQPVFDALRRVEESTRAIGPYVFCSRGGLPIDNHNFVNRVWRPLLRHLGLRMRRPYQMRHTCATLWLAAGENPEWIARQLGHTSTRMLFMVYSRFVPNLTRRDGSAFDQMVSGVIRGVVAANDEPGQKPATSDLSLASQEHSHG